MYFPFKQVKGQAFRLYFTVVDATNVFPNADVQIFTQISKDGGSFTTTTNAAVVISGGSGLMGRLYVDLTASEMNADTVLLGFKDNVGTALYGTVIVYTTTSTSSGISASDILNAQINELTSIPSSSDTLANKIQAIFQYMFFKRTVTATTETLVRSDSTTTLGTTSLSDNGTLFTKGKIQ